MKKLMLIFLGFAACALTPKEQLAKSLSLPVESLELAPSHAQKLTPIDTLISSKGSFPIHQISIKNLPLNEPLTLVSIDPFYWKKTTHFQFQINEDGSLNIEDQHVEEAPIVLKNLLKGQIVYLTAISSQEQFVMPIALDPPKASLEDADFSLLTTHRKGTHFLLEGRGLVPGEKIIVAESSGPLLRRHVLIANAEGNVSLNVEPIVFGRLGGFASLTLERGFCETQIHFPWGGRLEQASPHFQPLALTTKPSIDLIALSPKIEEKLYL